MQERIVAELRVLPDPFLALVVVPTRDHDEAAVTLLRVLGEEGRRGCYVTAGKPAATIQELFRLNDVQSALTYVDCVSAEGQPTRDSPTVRYVSSPKDLTMVGIQLNKSLAAKPRFAIVDSLNAFLPYNSKADALRFLHFFTSFARANQLSGVIIALADSDEQLLAEITQFCDVRIDL